MHGDSVQMAYGMRSGIPHCPGFYCGIQLLQNGNWSDCGACPRGTRVNLNYKCVPCNDVPTYYDCLYLIFMAGVPLAGHWFCIDHAIPQCALFRKLFFSAFLEIMISATVTLLLVPPFGTFTLKSCHVKSFSDWYTVFHNPSPNYEEEVYCTQEAVYPLYSMMFIFYAIAVTTMLIVRPFFLPMSDPNYRSGRRSLYAGLYMIPILAFIHAAFGGIIYYIFPYISIFASVVSNAVHYARKPNQTMKSLMQKSVNSKRSVLVLLAHWVSHAFGILSIMEPYPWIYASFVMLLIPVPALFYIFTAQFTDPNNLHAD